MEKGIASVALPAHPTPAEARFEQFFAPRFGHPAAERQLGRRVGGVLYVLGLRTKVVKMRRDPLLRRGAERGGSLRSDCSGEAKGIPT